jgi:hypothetical protein
MHIEDYGEWTEFFVKDKPVAWHAGHLHFEPIEGKTVSNMFGTHPAFENDIIGYSHYTNGKFQKGYGSQQHRVTIPEFELTSNPTIRISEIKQNRFNIIDRYNAASERAKDGKADPDRDS